MSDASEFERFMQSQRQGSGTDALEFEQFMASQANQPPAAGVDLAALERRTEAQMRADVQKAIPHALRGYTAQELAQRTPTPNPITPMQSVSRDEQLNNPYHRGAEQVISGVEQTSEATPRDIAGGTSKILRGGMEVAATPTLAAGIIAAPVATGAALLAGTVAQKGTEAGLKKLGVPKPYANLAGDLVGIVAAGLGAHRAGEASEAVRARFRGTRQTGESPRRTPPASVKPETAAAPELQQPAMTVEEFMAQRTKTTPPPVRRTRAKKAEPTPIPAEPRGASILGTETRIPVPGENKPPYEAVYALRELSDIQPSHNGANFEPNPNYELTNDRNYSKPENAERVVRQAQEFDPSYLLSDNPDATNGPPIVDQRGNVLGGSSRAMTLQRVYNSRPAAAQAYRDALETKAQAFGLDPNQVRQMKQPVLVREVRNVAEPQMAITDFNKVPTAALTLAERALADSKRVSDKTLDYLASKVADEGETGTLTKALAGPSGLQIVKRLVEDGILTPQERQQYIDERGVVTPEGKQRITRLMVGRLFDSPAEFEEAPAELRNKAERIVAPLVRVQDQPGWDLMPQVKEAFAILSEARQRGTRNLKDLKAQSNLFGGSGYDPEAFVLAEKLQSDGPIRLARTFRQYAADAELARNPSFFEPPTREEAFASAFGEPEGKSDADQFLNQMFGPSASEKQTFYEGSGLAGAVAEMFDRAGKNGEPPRNYSSLGAAKSKWIRNLSQLEQASPRAHEAAVTAASSRTRAAATINAAMPQIEKALGPDGPTPEVFRRTLIESRLLGIEKRWRELADAAESIPVEPEQTGLLNGKPIESRPRADLVRWVENGPLQLLSAMSDRSGLFEGRPIEGPPAQIAAALIQRGDLDGLRTFVADTFRRAADSVTRVMTPEEFQAVTQSAGFQRALPIYKDLVEKPLAKSHEENEGIFSTALGPLDTYYPLVPLNQARKVPIIPWRRTPYRVPENIGNRFATGLSPDYDARVAALKNRIAAAFRTNDRAALLRTLQEQGLLVPLRRGERAPTYIDAHGHSHPYIDIGGKRYQAERVDLDAARIITKPGEEATYVPPPAALLPKWLADELKPILAPEERGANPGVISRVLNLVNQFALAGPADAVYHSHNLIGTLVSNTPWVGEDLLSKSIGDTPFTKLVTAITKLATTDPMDARAAKDLEEMARLGLLPERYGSETFSKKFAEQTGAELKRPFFSWGPTLYGPKGIDIRARLIMYRTAKAMNPKATPLQLYKFSNQLGIYTRALQGSIERAVKSTGLSPFYTAGSTMIRNGINAWLGISPMPESGPGYRIAQQLSGGAVGVVAAWAGAYKAYTGKWPWDDRRAKLLQIPLNRHDRESRLGVALFGKDMRKTGYINFGFCAPLVSRGARALGISGSFRTAVEGGNAPQIIEGSMRDVANSALHPLAGPAPRAGMVFFMSKQPYLVPDREGGAQFMHALPKGAPLSTRALAVLQQANSFYGNVGAATGMGNPWKDQPGMPWLKTVLNMTGILGAPANSVAAEVALRQERNAVARAKHIREHRHHAAVPPVLRTGTPPMPRGSGQAQAAVAVR